TRATPGLLSHAPVLAPDTQAVLAAILAGQESRGPSDAHSRPAAGIPSGSALPLPLVLPSVGSEGAVPTSGPISESRDGKADTLERICAEKECTAAAPLVTSPEVWEASDSLSSQISRWSQACADYLAGALDPSPEASCPNFAPSVDEAWSPLSALPASPAA